MSGHTGWSRRFLPRLRMLATSWTAAAMVVVFAGVAPAATPARVSPSGAAASPHRSGARRGRGRRRR